MRSFCPPEGQHILRLISHLKRAPQQRQTKIGLAFQVNAFWSIVHSISHYFRFPASKIFCFCITKLHFLNYSQELQCNALQLFFEKYLTFCSTLHTQRTTCTLCHWLFLKIVVGIKAGNSCFIGISLFRSARTSWNGNKQVVFHPAGAL